jgi:signal transduction histidine kinase
MQISTMFAPAERATTEELTSQVSLVAGMPPIQRMLDSMMDMVLLLNRHRQIIFCNAAVAETFALPERSRIYGMRPGEAIGCANSLKHEGGCGTDEHCSVCGAVNTILAAIDGVQHAAECRILRSGGEAMDLNVKATPFRLAGEGLILVAMRDSSEQNRQRVMERIFHHDILNTACGIKLMAHMTTWSKRANRALDGISKGINRLIQEIQFQQDLTAAENGQLAVQKVPVRVIDLLSELIEASKLFAALQHCRIAPGRIPFDVSIVTDRRLLARVIGNMLKNAIEASGAGDEVAVNVSMGADCVSISVTNKAVMPRASQLQVFQRSFSTKGHGRGIGTYSMKLLTERYLGGRISFTSAEPQGTTFTATLPLNGLAGNQA